MSHLTVTECVPTLLDYGCWQSCVVCRSVVSESVPGLLEYSCWQSWNLCRLAVWQCVPGLLVYSCWQLWILCWPGVWQCAQLTWVYLMTVMNPVLASCLTVCPTYLSIIVDSCESCVGQLSDSVPGLLVYSCWQLWILCRPAVWQCAWLTWV